MYSTESHALERMTIAGNAEPSSPPSVPFSSSSIYLALRTLLASRKNKTILRKAVTNPNVRMSKIFLDSMRSTLI